MDEAAAAAKLEQVWRQFVPDTDTPAMQLERWRAQESDVECQLTVRSPASQRVVFAVCARYGIQPYRRARQRSTTICIKAPEGFVEKILWPLVDNMAGVVEEAAEQTTTRVLERWSSSTQREPSSPAL